MKSTITTDQFFDLVRREKAGEFGNDGIGKEFAWFADNWRIARAELRKDLPKHPNMQTIPDTIIRDDKPKDFTIDELDFLEASGNQWEDDICDIADKQQAALCVADAMKLLILQTHSPIPERFRNKYIIFTGTIIRCGNDNAELIWCLSSEHDIWHLVLVHRRRRFNHNFVLPLIKKGE